MFRCRGGAVPRGEVCKTGEAPPAEPREARREGAGGAQRRATRSAAGGHDPPLDAEPAGGNANFPQNLPAERVLPAPRVGNERFLLSFIGCARSAQAPELSVPRLRAGEIFCITTIQPSRAMLAETPVSDPRGCDSLYSRCTIAARYTCGNFRSRPARVPRNHFPRCKPRALPEIKDNRFPLHKHPVSTYPLPLTLAFSQKFTVPRNERHSPPRPSYPVGAGRGVLP